jgi:hypothetical protein
VRRIYQSRVDKRTGNCFEACVASLLECDLAIVPAYTEGNGRMQPYLERLDAWLRPQGLGVVTVKVDQKTTDDRSGPDRLPDFIASGTAWIASVDLGDVGYHHAVVMRGSELWHDPQRDSTACSLPDLAHRITAVTVLVARP